MFEHYRPRPANNKIRPVGHDLRGANPVPSATTRGLGGQYVPQRSQSFAG